MNLNSICEEKKSKPLVFQSTAAASANERNNVEIAKIKQPRADKIKDIKFPVTPAERTEFRRLAQKMAAERGMRKKCQTKINTNILQAAMNLYIRSPELFVKIETYNDTKQYLTVKPSRLLKQQLEELALDLNCSERRVVHLLMLTFLWKGGRCP